MKAMLLGFVAVAAIGVGANLYLKQAGWSAQEVHSSPNVRVD